MPITWDKEAEWQAQGYTDREIKLLKQLFKENKKREVTGIIAFLIGILIVLVFFMYAIQNKGEENHNEKIGFKTTVERSE